MRTKSASKTSWVVVTTTTGTRSAALALARRIVDARLAACAQVTPIHSIYRWKGRVESADETLLAAKTRSALAGRLIPFIRQHHTYELPEITVTPILGGLPGYLRWIEAETATPSHAGRRPRARQTP